LPIIAGVLPITSLKQLNRMSELSGTQIPTDILGRFEGKEEKSDEIKKIGIDIASELGEKLLELKAPGIHFYTMNSAESTVAIARNLGLIKL
jgi:methylenetetrahydrofolate reductase (NADPH)